MFDIIVLVAAAILLAVLLYFERNGSLIGKLPTKTILSCLFIAAAVIQPHPIRGYYYLLLLGLHLHQTSP